MDKHQAVLQLCLPWLYPADVSMLRCTCSQLRSMPLSSREHELEWVLDGSFSAMLWLHKNIVSIQSLYLEIVPKFPDQLLQGLLEGGRHLRFLGVNSAYTVQLPPLPSMLEHLDVSYCKRLQSLPALPNTLETLRCESCDALTELPDTLSSTALTELKCSECPKLQLIPELLACIKRIEAGVCESLRHLPELPEGLEALDVCCAALTEGLHTAFKGAGAIAHQRHHVGLRQLPPDYRDTRASNALPRQPGYQRHAAAKPPASTSSKGVSQAQHLRYWRHSATKPATASQEAVLRQDTYNAAAATARGPCCA